MKKVKRWVLLLFLGGILVTLASAGGEGKPFQQTFLDPGPLSHVHARVECNQCHSSDLDTWQGLLSSVLHRDGDTLGSQGCLHCHDQGSNAMFAHGVSPMGLRKKSGPAEIDPFMEQTECSICHLEHGHGQPLQALSDSRCQTCHHRKFDSFSNEHPEYSENYGNKARTFSFSHVDHARRHFGTEPDFAPTSCSSCHELEPATGVMSVRPFEVSCGKCHSEDISKSDAIKFFAFPTIIGLEEMEENGMGVGDWPYIDVLELTPWTQRWYKNSALKNELSDFMELAEIEADEPGNPTKTRQVQDFIMEVKRAFMKDMIKDLRSWIGKMLPVEMQQWTNEDLAKLSGQFPLALLIKVQERWFPELDHELNRFDRGLPISPEEEMVMPVEEEKAEPSGDSEDRDDQLLEEEGELLIEEDDLLISDSDEASEDDSKDAQEEQYSLKNTSSGKEWASLGGWYEDGGVIWYKAVQHEDQFLTAWLNAEIEHGGDDPVSKEILSLLLDEKGPGRCIKCHSGVSAETRKPHWKPHDDPLAERYTHFSHTVHVFSDDDFQCINCHTQRDGTSELGHDWYPVRMNACTQCHGQDVADDCTLCHQYHASPQIRKLNTPSIDIFKIKKD